MARNEKTNSIEVINAHPRTRLRRQPFRDDVDRVLSWGDVSGGTVRIIFVDRDSLLELNRSFLGHDYHTDVITFPIEEDPIEGEIYISIDMIGTQAREYGVSFYNEARRLAIHGTLHLLGFDDATDDGRGEMRELENRFLSL